MHAKRVTVNQKDMQLARRIRGDRHYDFVDRTTDENQLSLKLPHKMTKANMQDLQQTVAEMTQ